MYLHFDTLYNFAINAVPIPPHDPVTKTASTCGNKVELS